MSYTFDLGPLRFYLHSSIKEQDKNTWNWMLDHSKSTSEVETDDNIPFTCFLIKEGFFMSYISEELFKRNVHLISPSVKINFKPSKI